MLVSLHEMTLLGKEPLTKAGRPRLTGERGRFGQHGGPFRAGESVAPSLSSTFCFSGLTLPRLISSIVGKNPAKAENSTKTVIQQSPGTDQASGFWLFQPCVSRR